MYISHMSAAMTKLSIQQIGVHNTLNKYRTASKAFVEGRGQGDNV